MAKASIVVKKNNGGTIALNKRARHDYFIEEKFEAGLSLKGWEVKSMRAGRMTIVESYITFKNGEAFLFGAQVQPLLSASTHVVPEATRTRKLLLNRREIEKLMGATNVPPKKTVTGNVIKREFSINNGLKVEYKKTSAFGGFFMVLSMAI